MSRTTAAAKATTTDVPKIKWTQAELHDLLVERFGEDPSAWAFKCPACKDIATTADFKAALAAEPRTRRDGTPAMASDYLGRECIGRVTGALSMPAKEWKKSGARGCDWAAYGLFAGPWAIEIPKGDGSGETVIAYSFEVAPAPEGGAL